MGLLTKWKARNALRRLEREVAQTQVSVDREALIYAANLMGQSRRVRTIVIDDAVELVRPDSSRIRVEVQDGSLYSYTISPQGNERELNPLPVNGRDFYGTNVLEDMVGQNDGHLTFRDRTGAWFKKHGRWAGLAGGLGAVGLVWAYHAIPGTPKVTSPKELADFMTLLYTNMGPSLFYTAAGFLSAVAGAIPGYLGLRNLLEDDARYTHLRLEGKGTVDERRRLRGEVNRAHQRIDETNGDVARGSREVNGRIDGVNNGVRGLQNDLGNVSQRVGEVATNVDGLGRRVTNHGDILDRVVAATSSQLAQHEQRLDDDIQIWTENLQTLRTRIDEQTQAQVRLTGLLRAYGERTNTIVRTQEILRGELTLYRNQLNEQEITVERFEALALQFETMTQQQDDLYQRTDDRYYQQQAQQSREQARDYRSRAQPYRERASQLRRESQETEGRISSLEDEQTKIRNDEEATGTQLTYAQQAEEALTSIRHAKEELARRKQEYRNSIPTPAGTEYDRLRRDQEAIMRIEEELLNRIGREQPLDTPRETLGRYELRERV